MVYNLLPCLLRAEGRARHAQPGCAAEFAIQPPSFPSLLPSLQKEADALVAATDEMPALGTRDHLSPGARHAMPLFDPAAALDVPDPAALDYQGPDAGRAHYDHPV